MKPSQDLDDLLRRCTVRLRIPQDGSLGTGFLVATGRILTCAHVIETAQARPVPIEIDYGGRTYPGRILFCWLYYPRCYSLRSNWQSPCNGFLLCLSVDCIIG